MPLATSASIQLYTGLDAPAAQRAAVHALSAEVALCAELGDAAYAAACGDAELSPLAERAESLLAVAEALPLLNLRVTEKGGLVDAVGWDASRAEMLSQREITRLTDSLRERAMLLVRRIEAKLRTTDTPANETPLYVC